MATIFSRLWQTPTAIPVAKTNGVLLENDTRLYHVAGSSAAASTGTPEVYSAIVHADGTVDPWVVAGSLPISLHFNATVIHNDWMYVIGGFNTAGGRLDTVYAAKLGSAGVVGAWKVGNVPIPVATMVNPMGCVEVGGYLYSVSGANAAAFASCWSAKLNSDGSVSNWQELSAVPVAINITAVVHHNGWLYMMGGSTTGASAANQATVYSARIGTGGTLGPWTAVSSLPQPLGRTCGCVVGGYLTLFGGQNTAGSSLDKIFVSKLDTGGGLGPWTTDDTVLPAALRNTSVVAKAGRIWVGSGFGAARDPNVYSMQL